MGMFGNIFGLPEADPRLDEAVVGAFLEVAAPQKKNGEPRFHLFVPTPLQKRYFEARFARSLTGRTVCEEIAGVKYFRLPVAPSALVPLESTLLQTADTENLYGKARDAEVLRVATNAQARVRLKSQVNRTANALRDEEPVLTKMISEHGWGIDSLESHGRTASLLVPSNLITPTIEALAKLWPELDLKIETYPTENVKLRPLSCIQSSQKGFGQLLTRLLGPARMHDFFDDELASVAEVDTAIEGMLGRIRNDLPLHSLLTERAYFYTPPPHSTDRKFSPGMVPRERDSKIVFVNAHDRDSALQRILMHPEFADAVSGDFPTNCERLPCIDMKAVGEQLTLALSTLAGALKPVGPYTQIDAGKPRVATFSMVLQRMIRDEHPAPDISSTIGRF